MRNKQYAQQAITIGNDHDKSSTTR